MITAPRERAGGKLWDGIGTAAVFDGRVRKPVRHAVHDRVADGVAYRAELMSHVEGDAVSTGPVVSAAHPQLTAAWWKALRTDLDTVSRTQTARVAVRREWIAHAVPAVTGHPAPVVTQWATAHGDLHLANITADGTLLDWEGWGSAPAGYDAAMLLGYSLTVPEVSRAIRHSFRDLLETPPGRAAQLIVATELLQSVGRGDHPELEQPLRELAADAAAAR
ncbi:MULTISPECIES: phosphotransferase [unclassified Streptomyces]|uniref:phosphotransferase n=1 Tax=unclassified Streptomyces TaxID=2593676 RepID=UPI000CD4B5E3|nr:MULTISPECIES: phosphotransferase [unclassified Streptomyces]